MSTGNDNSGCLFQIMTVILSMWFGFGLFAGDSVSVESPPVLEVTADIISPADEDMPFAVLDNTITYHHTETLDKPCNYLIEGYVLDLEGNPFTDFVVNIEMLPLEEGMESGPIGHSFPGYSSTVDYGPSGWGTLLPTWQGIYKIWLSQTVDGERMSAYVLVQTQDCDHNVAVVNFVQVRPIE